ncbi:hypothetical protein [Maribacter sp. 4U21]|uniref:hypothetical protein n=1 Tax=Maribacter sp. 4U21 TaxID=1889779 RepID=UPI00117C0A90|nr:hypothetical protein [Maribacter sp. 4U21]
MNRAAATQRIKKLRDCLAWSLQNNRLLTDSQRICLNQERAAWLALLREDDLNPGHAREPQYRVPPELESRINQIGILIQSSGWDRYYNYERQFSTI